MASSPAQIEKTALLIEKTENMMRIEFEILGAFDDSGGGYVVRDIARHVTYSQTNKRARSAAVKYLLFQFERSGLVRRMDDKLPICWQRTQAGFNAWFQEERRQQEEATYWPSARK